MDHELAVPPGLPRPPAPSPAGAPPAAPVDRAHLRAHSLGSGALGLSALGFGLVAARTLSLDGPPCPLRALTGVPCPGCGMTRLADTVAHGHLSTALGADPAGVAVLVAIAVLAVSHLVVVRARRLPPPRWMRSWAVPVGLGVLVAVHWATTLVTGGLPSA